MSRRRPQVHELSSEQDIFHNYQWPDSICTGGEQHSRAGGRPRYQWTVQMSLQLITLVIHTDIKFDDIPAALKNGNGDGPSDSTCRKHWHEIFGYRPNTARLSNAEGQRRRRDKQIAAFRAWQQRERPPWTSTQLASRISFESLPSVASKTSTDASNSIREIEDKEDYPRGFVSWIKKAGLQICLDDLEEYASTNHRQSIYRYSSHSSNQNSICRVFERYQPTDDHLTSLLAHIEGLLRNGANSNEANERGETALHLATALGHIPVVTLLLEYGADLHQCTTSGESTWAFAGRVLERLMETKDDEIDDEDLLCLVRACARIEFTRTTVEFNSNLVFKGTSRKVDRSCYSTGVTDHSNVPGVPSAVGPVSTQEIMVAPIAHEELQWSPTGEFGELNLFTGGFPLGDIPYGQDFYDLEHYEQWFGGEEPHDR